MSSVASPGGHSIQRARGTEMPGCIFPGRATNGVHAPVPDQLATDGAFLSASEEGAHSGDDVGAATVFEVCKTVLYPGEVGRGGWWNAIAPPGVVDVARPLPLQGDGRLQDDVPRLQ